MPGPLAATIEAANESLLVNGNDAADRFFAPGYVAHGTGRDLTGGPDAVRRFVGMLHGAFSNLEVTVDILAETADRVAWQRTLAGTQSGSYMGFPATGRRVVWRDMIVSRFVDGVIAEDWVVTDLAERRLLARKG